MRILKDVWDWFIVTDREGKIPDEWLKEFYEPTTNDIVETEVKSLRSLGPINSIYLEPNRLTMPNLMKRIIRKNHKSGIDYWMSKYDMIKD